MIIASDEQSLSQLGHWPWSRAPIAHAEHARLACRTALDMTARLKELKARWQRQGRPSVGIHTGPMIVGNMDSAARFNYTVIGAAVNLGARLASLNKACGTHILLSEFTPAQVREIDRVRVRGRESRVRAYELIAPGQRARLDWPADFDKPAAGSNRALSKTLRRAASRYMRRCAIR